MASAEDLKIDVADVWFEKEKYETAFEQLVISGYAGNTDVLVSRLSHLEKENADLKKVVSSLQASLSALDARVAAFEKSGAASAPAAAAAAPAAAAPAAAEEEEDIDLFGDDEVDEEAEKLKAARVAEYNAKKAQKAAKGDVLIPKSNILLDVKPWDDETDMKEMERLVRSIEADGLIWGASKLLPVGYGIQKLQICCVVEDDKVGTDFLEESICNFEDYVQSVDIAAFNKI